MKIAAELPAKTDVPVAGVLAQGGLRDGIPDLSDALPHCMCMWSSSLVGPTPGVSRPIGRIGTSTVTGGSCSNRNVSGKLSPATKGFLRPVNMTW